MIELPRAALTADEIAKSAEFFSFGTNDLTQTTLGVSRDDAATFLGHYLNPKITGTDPFQPIAFSGPGHPVRMRVGKGRSTRKNLKFGSGDHLGADAAPVT